MPEPKLVARGSVSHIIDRLHKLEYESGRMAQPAQPKSRNTLANDHPAQRPRGDRPVPFHERPVVRYHEPEQIDHAAFRFDPELEKQNPFRRRDSTGSNICGTPPRQRRESLSHKAFDRVRNMSVSPPLVAPIPRVEIAPWYETAEQYISRKLTERWSPPSSRSASISHSQVGRSRSSQRVESPHVDAPLVQDILLNIDKILMEHTGTLRDVIEDSKRVLHVREMQCFDTSPVANGHHEDDVTSRTSSTVPELIAAVDQTAQHMGLRLPDFDQRHPPTIQGGQCGRIQALSPVSPRSHVSPQAYEYEAVSRHDYGHQQHRRDSNSSIMHGALRPEFSQSHHLPSVPSHEPLRSSDYAHPPSYESLRTLSSKPEQHYHISPLSTHEQEGPSANLYYRKSSDPDYEGHLGYSRHHEHSPRDLYTYQEATLHTPGHLSRHYSHVGSPSQHARSPADHVADTRSVASDFGSIEHRAMSAPSPAFMEYDRFAALADRASRNSIVDLVDTVALCNSSTNMEGIQRKLDDFGRNSIPEVPDEPGPLQVNTPDPVVDQPKPKRNKISDSWLEKGSVPKERGKMKRVGTMDRLMEKEGYESKVKKRVKQEVPMDEPALKKASKRETMKMMDSIMTRQGRDKERAAGWTK